MNYNVSELKQLQQQNSILEESIGQLNFCYQQKVSILEQEIRTYEHKYEKVLEDKRDEADRMAHQIGRYQTQITKLLNLVDTFYNSFQLQKQAFAQQLAQKNQIIAQLQQQRQQDQKKVQELAEKYTFEITKLQQDLKELKEEEQKRSKSEGQNKQEYLKDITSLNNINDIPHQEGHIQKINNFQSQEVFNQ